MFDKDVTHLITEKKLRSKSLTALLLVAEFKNIKG